MNISFKGVEETIVTFKCGTATAGQPVSLSENNKVAACSSGDIPIGVLINKRGNFAAVQIRGYVELPYSGTISAVGWTELMADGTGKLTVPDSTKSEVGKSYLVVNLDTTANKIGLFL